MLSFPKIKSTFVSVVIFSKIMSIFVSVQGFLCRALYTYSGLSLLLECKLGILIILLHFKAYTRVFGMKWKVARA